MKTKQSVYLLVSLLAFPVAASAANLLQAYQDAKVFDAEYAAAQATLEASREKLPQGRALLLPSVTLSRNYTRTNLDVDYDDASGLPRDQRDYRSDSYSLTLTQPLMRAQNWLQYKQAGQAVQQAEASFAAARQSLILRVAQAYFDVLAAQDTLALAGAQKTAISEQLEQAKRNFETGTTTITDTHEAQARHDLANAQEIAARNDLDIKQRILQRLTGKSYTLLQRLPERMTLTPPEGDLQRWIEITESQNFSVAAQRTQVEVQQLEVRRNQAGHLPTLDLVVSYGDNNQTGSQLSAIGNHATTGTLGVQFNVALFSGGVTSSRVREASSLLDKARADFDNARRQQAQATEQNYLNVVNGIAQVRALEQALTSSESALESNKLGYDVGVRINIDVLNAQQQVYSTRRDLALARYNTILNLLRLKASAGALQEPDLEQVNAVLPAHAAIKQSHTLTSQGDRHENSSTL
ncbi:MAG: TolC family outer membrane protein [Gammaproteobacteria bacterium]|nr:TolC family outer membrane protein [Gammaproteobacteria bacterium]